MKRERIEELAEVIDKRGRITLEQLEEVFPDVSQMTLRRDLLKLEEDNRIIRIRGGAISVKEVQKVSAEEYTKKTTINTDAKIVIAQKAAGLIDENTSIFLDGGTTAMYLTKEMPARKKKRKECFRQCILILSPVPRDCPKFTSLYWTVFRANR